MIEIKKLFKLERGTGKKKVPVKRESGIHLEYRRVGRKPSPRTGTGKLGKFPESIKKEILEQRSYGESGAKIKKVVEDMIDHGLHPDAGTTKKLHDLNIEYRSSSHHKYPETQAFEITEKKFRDKNKKIQSESKSTISTYINGKPTGRNLLEEGIINESGKLTVTAQALTNWAKIQGVESTKKRTSAVDAEKVKHADTKKDLDRADKKVAQLEVQAEHLKNDVKLIQQSKMKSDEIRGQLGTENKDLQDKLKACLSKK